MVTKNFRDNFAKIAPYVSGEQPKMDGLIKLNSNENPYPPSPKVKKAAATIESAKLSLYPSSDAEELIDKLADYHGLKTENVFVGNGSDEVLGLAFRAFFNSELPIAYPDITYSFYPVWCEFFKIPFVTFALDDSFRINADDYIAPNGGVVITNPNAPTSIGERTDFIRKILDNNRDVVVIVDEAYVDFGGSSSIELIQEYDNLLVVHTFSKSRSLAGIRVGACFGNSELIAVMNTVKNSFNSYPVDTIAQKLAIASLDDESYFSDIVHEIITTRENTVKALEQLGFHTLESSTNFIFTTHESIHAKEIFVHLREDKILVRYFNKPRIGNYLRITIGTAAQMDALIESLERLI